MRSSPGSAPAALILTIAALAGTAAAAHRLDEYLQAARIAIDPDRVQIELDLTPGIAVAPAVLTQIDADRSGSLSVEEGRAYATRVMADIQLLVDDEPLALALTGSRIPTLEALLKGEGTIRFHLNADVRRRDADVHRLVYSNRHRRDIGVYLANTLVPATERVIVVAQHRDPRQHELVVEYVLRDDPAAQVRWWLPAVIGLVLTILAGVLWRRLA